MLHEKKHLLGAIILLGLAACSHHKQMSPNLERRIQEADHMPQGTARLLLAILGLILYIEEILAELKKLHGIG